MTTIIERPAAEDAIRERLAHNHSLYTIEIDDVRTVGNGGTLVTYFCKPSSDSLAPLQRVAYWARDQHFNESPHWDMIAG